MKIDVRFRAMDASDALREYVARRVHFQLSRFQADIGTVLVRLADINGPKGGADKRCQVTIRGSELGSMTVEDFSEDAYSAVDLAMERAARAVARDLKRARDSRRPSLRLTGALWS